MQGLNRDYNIINQPKDTYTFALNATVSTTDAKFANVSNEPSNVLQAILKEGYTIYGTIFTNDSNIIFSGNGIDSEIGEFKNDQYSILLSDVGETCKLNFTDIIKGKEYRIKSGCDRTIYWTDNINPDRYLNLDSIDAVYTNGELDCDKLVFTPSVSIPNIELQVNNQGGLLETGQYSFVIEYLDDSENVIYKSIPTKYIPIYFDSLSNEYEDINGSLNIDQYLAEVGGQPTTNKSITITIDNVDESISQIRINVIRLTSGNGVTNTAHTIGQLLPASIQEYTYTGFNTNNGDILISYDSLITRNVNYTRSRTIEQVQNRLVRANVTELTRDYSSYQRFANDITTRPQLRTELAKNINTEFNSKNPQSYIDGMTFQGDEIYAFGIVYQHNDGNESPPFHIPGRDKIVGIDDIIIPYNINNPDLKHLPVKAEYEQWEVYNTADYSTQGVRMSYFETDTLYPDTLDCNGELIYGELSGTPIKHHKFPCRKLIPLQTEVDGEWYLNYLGIEFNNVVYPDASIVSHRFVYAKRDQFNKTVLDAGYLTGLGKSADDNISLSFSAGSYSIVTDGIIVNPDERYSTTHFQFISPKTLTRRFTSSNYIKFNETAQELGVLAGSATADREDGGTIDQGFFLGTNGQQFETIPNYRSIVNNSFISANSLQNDINGFDVRNTSLNNGNIIVFNDELNGIIDSDIFNSIQTRVIYSYAKQYIIPFSNLESLQYCKLSNNITDISYVSFEGDTFVNELNTVDYGVSTITGDSLVTTINGHVNFYIESDINFDLKLEGTGCNVVWDGKSDTPDSLFLYGITRVATGSPGSYVLRESTCLPYWNYNSDLNYYPSYSLLPLSFNYDYCDRCLSIKPNRIIFSPKSFDEEQADMYLINKVNDYIDIPQERGEITGLKYKNNKLYVHTTDSTFVLQPNPQAISTDQNIAYLTTGDFLSIPPQEMMTTDLGYGGMQYELANINTEFGYFWADQKRGQIFRLGQSLDAISNKGLTMWFKENMFNNVQLGYDPYFQRIIFHHANSENCRNDWTLGFYPFYDAFISFYSYFPDLLFSTHDTLYTIKNNEIYKHRKRGSYCNFYQEQFPFIIEEVQNDFSTNNLNSIHYYTEFYNDTLFDLNEINNVNYTNLVCYNNIQSSGLLNLQLIDQINNPYSNYNVIPNTKTIIRTDKNSKISNLYDYSISTNVTQKECRQSNLYQETEFINTDSTKSQYEYSMFKDKHVKARLIFNPPQDNIKVIHYLTQLNESKSIR